MMSTNAPDRTQSRKWLQYGAIMGLVAGLIFAAFEMIMAAILQGNAFGPIRMIGAIVLGQQAIDPAYSFATAILTGLVVHLVLSTIYGLIFGAIMMALPQGRQNRMNVIWIATAFGLLLWLANFYVVAPLLFPWFTNANPLVQFVAHTFFYGTALGLLLASRNDLIAFSTMTVEGRERRREQQAQQEARQGR
jgi:uncharacterized membrane protein YagU involved in acid resistance